MTVFTLMAFLLIAPSGASFVNPKATSLLSFDEAGAKNRPVAKVITLLKDMMKQMENEQEEDEQVYDQMACWCETNDKDKTKAVKDAEERLDKLTTSIEELTAQSSRLTSEVANLKKEVEANQKALDQATALRQKQLAEFNEEEKDLLGSISALKSSITILEKHHSSKALLQDASSSELVGVASNMKNAMSKHHAMLLGVLTPKDRRKVESFAQAPSYAPQSGEIFGILRQMQETFETNLAAAQKEELSNQKGYEAIKEAKEGELEAAQEQMDTKTQELATADEKNAQAKQDSEDTTQSLAADQQFLAMLKEKCSMTDTEWQERQKARQAEISACSKALSVLSSDESHDLFTKTFNFVQVESSIVSKRRQQAASLLKGVAAKLGNPRLSELAQRVSLDAFARVKKAIDDMVGQLVKEKADEIKHRDFCTDEFNTNALQTEKKNREKQDHLAKIEDLSMSIKQTGDAIKALEGEVAEANKQIARAKEDRDKQNKEFQKTVNDQQATQKLLNQALKVLKSFYEKAPAQLLQTAQAPGGFKAYSQNAAAGGVMNLLTQIINDAKAMEAEATKDEEASVAMYEDMVKDTTKTIEEKNKNINHKQSTKARAEADLVEAKADQEAVLLELEQLSNVNAELHGSCDFVVKNFEIRQQARDEEIDALKQAKAILSGAKFGDFLQMSA